MQRTISLSKILGVQGVGTKELSVRYKLIKKVVILLLVIIGSALFCVWSRVRIVQMGYETSILQKRSIELSKKVNHLQLEVERLKSPGRLQKVATEILGMHPPASGEIIFIKKSTQ